MKQRPTRSISPRKLWLLRPVLRYSYTAEAYVYRVGGRRWGPMFRPRDNSGLPTVPQPVEFAPAESSNDGIVQPAGSNGKYSPSSEGHAVSVADQDKKTAESPPIGARPTLTIVRDQGSPQCSSEGGRKLMRPFSDTNQCPKCGGGQASIAYHDPGTGQKGCDPGEHIHRECLTCGFPWSDACLELDEYRPSMSTAADEAS